MSPSVIDILTSSDIKSIGLLLLDCLGRLKHMGAIAETATALQSLTLTLLKYGSKHSYLSSLPYQWLTYLIYRLTNYQQIFILRRSAGFAYSFLSILRSEPANSQPILLIYTMKSLLEITEQGLLESSSCNNNSSNISGDGDNNSSGKELWKLSVHALNVIRLILLDSSFGYDLDSFIIRIMILIIQGFASSIWSIRNSSMMCFSAIIQRIICRKDKNASLSSSSLPMDVEFLHCSLLSSLPFVDSTIFVPSPSPALSSEPHMAVSVEEERNPLGDSGSITIEEFFNRFYDLFPFLVSLFQEKLLPSFIRSPSSSSSSFSTVVVDPQNQHLENSLYSILLLFSKLKLLLSTSSNPDDGSLGNAPVNYSKPFLPFLEQCCYYHPNIRIRMISSKAFSKILSVDSYCSFLIDKVNQLQVTIDSLLSLSTPSGFSEKRNEIHGRLLQIYEMLIQYYHYFLLYPPSVSSTNRNNVPIEGGEVESGASRVVEMERFHHCFLTVFKDLLSIFFSKYYFPYHSLLILEIFQQYQGLLKLFVGFKASSSSFQRYYQAMITMKHEFIIHYLISTKPYYSLVSSANATYHPSPFFPSPAQFFPYFPHNIQLFLETILTENPFIIIRRSQSQQDDKMTIDGGSSTLLSWIIKEDLLSPTSIIREVKLGILSGVFSYFQLLSLSQRKQKKQNIFNNSSSISNEFLELYPFVQLLMKRIQQEKDEIVLLSLIQVFHQ
jgi:hypothetical protein